MSLYSNNSVRILCFLFICLSHTGLSQSADTIQTGINTISRKSIQPLKRDDLVKNYIPVIIPDSLSKEDAVIIFREQRITLKIEPIKRTPGYDYEYVNGKLKKIDPNDQLNAKAIVSEIITKRIKLNTKKGVDDHSIVSISFTPSEKINIMYAKTLKPDGSDFELDMDNLKTTTQIDKEGKRYNTVKFTLPNALPGDEIEYKYVITSESFQPKNLFFHDILPILKSTISIDAYDGIGIKTQIYNNPAGSRSTIYGNEWTLTALNALSGQKYLMPYNSLPYVSYCVSDIRVSTKYGHQKVELLPSRWIDWSYLFLAVLKKRDPKQKYYEYFSEFINNVLAGKDSLRKVEKLKILFEYIQENIELKNFDNPKDNLYTSGYYLKKGYIDKANLFILYKDIFEHLDIDYYFGLARDKMLGSIDPSFMTNQSITDYLFIVKDDIGKYRYIFPSDGFFNYRIDEVPPHLTGTEALMIPKYPVDEVLQSRLPGGDIKKNYRLRKAEFKLNKSQNNIEVKMDIVVSGIISTLARMYHNYAQTDSVSRTYNRLIKNIDSSFKYDTFYLEKPEDYYPFKAKVKFEGKEENVLTKIADSLYTLDLKYWFDHNYLELGEETPSFDICPDFIYTDKFTYYLTSEVPFEIINKEKIIKSCGSEYLDYSMSIKTINNKIVLIESKYSIKKPFIPLKKYPYIKEVNQCFKDIENAQFLIKFIE